MPHTRTITTYTIDELSPAAKQRALDNHRYWNVEDFDWWDFTVDDIEAFGQTSGLYCRYGGAFDLGSRDFVAIEGFSTRLSVMLVSREDVRRGYPDIAAQIMDPFWHQFSARDLRNLLRCVRRDILGSLTGVTGRGRYGNVRAEVERFDCDTRHPRISALLDRLESAWENLLRDLQSYFLHLLRVEYEYLTSDEAVAESLRTNEAQFDAEGHIDH